MKLEKGYIKIEKKRGFWWADWSHTCEACHVKLVQGSAIVPLAHLDTVPARLVCREVSKNNPGFVVISSPELQGEALVVRGI